MYKTTPLKGRARHEFEGRVLSSRMTSAEHHLAVVLLRYAGGKAECWPCNRTLAAEVRKVHRQVQRLLKALEHNGVIRAVEARWLPTQRLIVFLAHPGAERLLVGLGHDAPRGDILVTPRDAPRGDISVHLGVTSTSPESCIKNPPEGETFAIGGEGGVSRGLLAYSRLRPMDAASAMDRAAVRGWVAEAFDAIAPGEDYRAAEDLVRIAAGRDEARLGLDVERIKERAWWIDCALRELQPPAIDDLIGAAS